MPFAGFASFEECVDKVTAAGSADDPEAVCGALKAEHEKRATLTQAEVMKLCPPCGQLMKKRGLTAIHGDEVATLLGKKSDVTFGIIKTDEDQQLVYGYASVAVTNDGGELVDLQGDIIEPAELERAAHDYVLNARVAHEMHGEQPIGDLVEAVMVTPEKLHAMGLMNKVAPQVGLWVGYKVRNPEAWAKVKDGTYKMFSIRGTADEIPA